MQMAGDADLAAAVAADVRDVVWKLEVDWDRNGTYASTYSDLTDVVRYMMVDRQVSGVLPPEVTMVEGYMSAVGTVRLSGTRKVDSQPISQLLSPWRTDSPLFGNDPYGAKVRIWMGHRKADGTLGMPQQLQGVVADLRALSSSGEILLTIADDADPMSVPIDLPLWALPPDSSTSLGVNLLYRINSQWVIDYILRKNGYYMSPPPQTGCMWLSTMHGSMIPEIGHQAYFWTGIGKCDETDPVSWPGRPGWGLAYGGAVGYYGVGGSRTAATSFTPRANNSISFQFQADTAKAAFVHSAGGYVVGYSSGGGYLQGASFIVRVSGFGQIFLDLFHDTTQLGTVTGPTLAGAGWHDVWVRVDIGSSMANSTVRFPGMTVLNVDLSGMAASGVSTYPWITTWAHFPVHDIQICNATGQAAGATLYDAANWVPQCDLDPGLNELTGMPLRRGVESWSLLKEVATAEYGVVGFSESGRPFFYNRDSVRRNNLAFEQEISDRKEILDLGLSYRAGSVRNVVSGTIAERKIDGPLTSIKAWRTVFTLKNATDIILGPGTTQVDFVLDEPQPILDLSPPSAFTTANWDSQQPKAGFVATTLGGAAVASGVSVSSVLPLNPATLGVDKVRVFFVNDNATTTVRLATTAGDPAFKLQGRAYYTDKPTEIEHRRNNSIARYKERTYEIPANEWHQLPGALQTIATSLLRDLQRPVPVIDQADLVGDCRRQLLDSLVVEDRGELGGPQYTTLVGLQRTLEVTEQGGKITDRVNLRPFGAPGYWILGHSVWGVLGQTTKV